MSSFIVVRRSRWRAWRHLSLYMRQQVSRDQQIVYYWPHGVGQATCFKGVADISSLDQENDWVTWHHVVSWNVLRKSRYMTDERAPAVGNCLQYCRTDNCQGGDFHIAELQIWYYQHILVILHELGVASLLHLLGIYVILCIQVYLYTARDYSHYY